MPLKPALLGALVGLLCAIGIKAFMIRGIPLGQSATDVERLGILLMLSLPFAALLVVVGLVVRRRRPGVLPFASAMLVISMLPFVLR
jgi:hypothetical protein